MKFTLTFSAVAIVMLALLADSAAQSAVQKSDAHDTSQQSLGSIKPSTKLSKGITKVHPVKPLNYPKTQPGAVGPQRANPNAIQRKTDRKFGQPSPKIEDGADKKTAPQGSVAQPGPPHQAPTFMRSSTMTSSAPLDAGFEGLGENGRSDTNYAVDSAPSDTNGSVSHTQFVEWVNEELVVFDKQTGKVKAGPIPGNEIWKNFARSANGDLHPCEKDNDGDPIVLYDKIENRWILSQFAIEEDPDFYECIAISTTDDATGTYNRYAYKFDRFNDYPKISVWHDGYYMTFNMFNKNVQVGTKVCVLNKEPMKNGAAGQMICVDLPVDGGVGGLLAADLDGQVPTTKPPEYLMNLGFNKLQLWTMSVDWNSGSATLSLPKDIAVLPFTAACESRSGGSCITQPGTAPFLEALGDRLMYRLQYRHFEDHDVLLANHSVGVQAGANQYITGIRWYEIRDLGATKPTVFQQSTYAPDSNFRWMGTLATDKQGNLFVGYSVSGKKTFPSIRFAGRLASDLPGTLSSEETAVEGAGVQVAGDRWGDYSSVSLDPDDDCTFWFAAQYQKANGSTNAYNWHTYIKRVKFPGCN